MQISHVAFFDGAAQTGIVIRELYAVAFHDVAGAADGCCPVVAMLGNTIARAGDDKTGTGGDVEGVLAVSSCPDNVQWVVGGQVYRDTLFEQGIAEAQQFVDNDTAHTEGGEEGGNLYIGTVATGNVFHYLAGFAAGKLFVTEESLEYFFHC